MNLSHFFEHWRIVENPFKGEEARDDAVFARLGLPEGAGRAGPISAHSDFEKILGSMVRPSTAVVFGEKGSGKTALRMQVTEHIRRHNAADPEQGVWVISYDDLNSVLDTLHERSGPEGADESLASIRLVDHMDALLGLATTSIVEQMIEGPASRSPSPVPSEPSKLIRKGGREAVRDLVLLQSVYDCSDQAPARGRDLRRRFGVWPSRGRLAWMALAWGGWVAPAIVAWFGFFGASGDQPKLAAAAQIVAAILGVAWLALAGKEFVYERFRVKRLGARLRKQLRTLRRDEASFAGSVAGLASEDQSGLVLPLTDSDETRYAMLERLKRTLVRLGYPGVIVLVDRVDEPTLINGDAERMRSVIWPMFNNKFLQQEGFGLKMLLPVELRHALFKESSAFFQEARLDKQNLVERLTWTGSMLYDLCDARLKACLEEGAEPVALMDLFAEDVTGRDLVDALDQMHQPRDAFKLMYRCLSEHCSNVTAEQGEWRVPRLVLESVRKQESDRVQQLYRGIRPA